MFNPKFTAHTTDNTNEVLVEAKGFLGRTEMRIPLSLDQFYEGATNYNKGAHIQDAFPTLSSTQREFLISGMDEKMQKEFFT